MGVRDCAFFGGVRSAIRVCSGKISELAMHELLRVSGNLVQAVRRQRPCLRLWLLSRRLRQRLDSKPALKVWRWLWRKQGTASWVGHRKRGWLARCKSPVESELAQPCWDGV